MPSQPAGNFPPLLVSPDPNALYGTPGLTAGQIEIPSASGVLLPSPRAQAQALQTLKEELTVTLTEESTTSVSSPVTIAAGVGGVLSTNVPWTYQQANLVANSSNLAAAKHPYGTFGIDAAYPYQVMFDFDGETLGVKFSTAEKGARIRIWANDVCTGYFEPKRPAYFLKINFGSRASRRIIIECDCNFFFGGIIRSKTDTISPPSESSVGSLAVVGDSFGRGSGIVEGEGEQRSSSQSYVYTLGRILGFASTRNFSVPGTGFLNGGSFFPYGQRIVGTVNVYQPTVLLLQGSINDRLFAGAGALEKAIVSLVNEVKVGSPNTLIVGVTPFPTTTSGHAENEANALEVAAGFTAAHIPYVDGFKAEWIYGNGHVGATTGEGNSDLYCSGISTVHPSLAGHNYLAQRIAQALAPILGVSL